MLIAINEFPGKPRPFATEMEQSRFFWKYNRAFNNVNVSVDEAIEMIAVNGWGYTTQHSGVRSEANFIAGQHLSLDYDNGTDIQSVLDLPLVKEYASFLYTTPSHTAEHPRFRVFFALDRPIRNVGKYHIAARSLIHNFPGVDRSCSDPARLFFGSVKGQVIKLGNIMALEALSPLVKEYKEWLKSQVVAPPTNIADAGDVSAGRIEALMKSICDNFVSAPDGEKHYALVRVSRTIGGYVGGGYLSLNDAQGFIMGALAERAAEIKSMRAAQKTMRDMLEIGMRDPLYMSNRDRTTARPTVAATPAQREEIEAAYMEGYRAGFGDALRLYGLDSGLVSAQWGVMPHVDKETGEISDSTLLVPFRQPDDRIANVMYVDGKDTYYAAEIGEIFWNDPSIDAGKSRLIVTRTVEEAMKTWLVAGGGDVGVVALPAELRNNTSDYARKFLSHAVIVDDIGAETMPGLRHVQLPMPLDRLNPDKEFIERLYAQAQ